jgi:hypothetical protein
MTKLMRRTISVCCLLTALSYGNSVTAAEKTVFRVFPLADFLLDGGTCVSPPGPFSNANVRLARGAYSVVAQVGIFNHATTGGNPALPVDTFYRCSLLVNGNPVVGSIVFLRSGTSGTVPLVAAIKGSADMTVAIQCSRDAGPCGMFRLENESITATQVDRVE